MRKLISTLFIFSLLSVPAFGGMTSIVNSEKYEVIQKSVFPYPAVSPINSIYDFKFVDPETGFVEEKVPIPGYSSLVIDGTFHFHTKFSFDDQMKNFSIEGNISSLGAFAHDDLGNKYLIKGDYRFNFENFIFEGKYLEVNGKVPFKLIDANSNHEYIIYGYTYMVFDPVNGCTKRGISFGK